MAVFYVPDDRSDGYGFACADASGPGELARICRRTIFLERDSAERRNGGGANGAFCEGAAFSANAGLSGRCPRRGVWEFFAVGCRGGLQKGSRTRGHGNG